jgi:DMSO/TMAO reductase YedYZ molybdopterin-dependent catalytic subunit
MNEQTLIAYATNGQPLLAEHGFPARLYTPNRYGMKNPKWLTAIEAIGSAYGGYWEQGGWNKDAIVKTTSVIDAIDVDQAQSGSVPVGGIAFAGARGFNSVELSIDGGAWQPAQLKAPLSPLTWRLWRFNWNAPKGHHTLVVRATDGTGALQTSDQAPLHPDGASGYVSDTADVL